MVDDDSVNDGAEATRLAVGARGGRPRGEAREALAQAARWYQEQRTMAPLEGTEGELLIGATWHELRQRACLARGHGVVVLKNMVRAGELRRIGRTLVEGYERAQGVYAPGDKRLPGWALDFEPLGQALDAMARSQG